MKRIIAIVAIATILASCANNEKKEALMKEQALVAIKDSLKLDSFKKAEIAQKEAELIKKEKELEEKHQAELAAAKRATHTVYSSSGRSTNYAAGNTTTAQKKGWSSAAKGTAIGAGVGALTGVIVDKKDGRGAVIGGLAGAGAGYLIGRDKDKKSGRVQ